MSDEDLELLNAKARILMMTREQETGSNVAAPDDSGDADEAKAERDEEDDEEEDGEDEEDESASGKETVKDLERAARQARDRLKEAKCLEKKASAKPVVSPALMLKISAGIVAFALLTGLAFYLSGVLVLALLKAPGSATFFSWFEYSAAYGADPLYAKKIKVAVLIPFLVCYLLPLLGFAATRKALRELHGSARFATDSEIRKSGLLGNTKGILVGRHRGRYLSFPGAQFVALLAPTRSGKGVGCVIPNLLNWPESVVVQDIKLENWDLTAGFRKKHGQKCYLFNPFTENERTARYNPLAYVRDGVLRVGDLNAIGESFFPSETPNGGDAFFNNQARNLFVGLGLYLCETPDLPRTIGEMLRQSSGKGKSTKAHLEGIISARNFICNEEGERVAPRKWVPGDGGLPPLSEDCVNSLDRFIGITGNTQSSVLASFNAPLGIWQSPIVDAATSANDFDLREVRKQRVSIYVGITPDHLAEAGVLLNLFWSQLINLNTKELPNQNPALKYSCLMIMDEFTAPGKIGILAKSVSYMAGYNMRLLTIAQSVAQLQGKYGKEDARTLMTNHAMQILYAPKEQEDAEEYSKILGYETVRAKSESRSSGRSGGGRGESYSEQRRALMLPQELRELGQWKEIIIAENMKPISCDKIKYFEDAVFKARLLLAPRIPRLKLKIFEAMKENRAREVTDADFGKKGLIDLDCVRMTGEMPEVDSVLLNDPNHRASQKQVDNFVSGLLDGLDLVREANAFHAAAYGSEPLSGAKAENTEIPEDVDLSFPDDDAQFEMLDAEDVTHVGDAEEALTDDGEMDGDAVTDLSGIRLEEVFPNDDS